MQRVFLPCALTAVTTGEYPRLPAITEHEGCVAKIFGSITRQDTWIGDGTKEEPPESLKK